MTDSLLYRVLEDIPPREKIFVVFDQNLKATKTKKQTNIYILMRVHALI